MVADVDNSLFEANIVPLKPDYFALAQSAEDTKVDSRPCPRIIVIQF